MKIIKTPIALFIMGLICFVSGCITTESMSEEEIQDYDTIKSALAQVEKTPDNYRATGLNNDLRSGGLIKTTRIGNIYLDKTPAPNGSQHRRDEMRIRLIENKHLTESYNKDLLELFNSARGAIYNNELIRAEIKKQRNLEIIKSSLLSIQENPTGFVTYLDKMISKDETLIGTEYRSSLDIKNILLSDESIYLTFTKHSSLQDATILTNKYMTDLFYSSCQAVRKRRGEIAQLEAKKEADIAHKKLADQKALDKRLFNQKKAKQLAKKEAFDRINKACIDAGYEGYCAATIPSTISITQEKGGLEEFLNWVIDYPTGELYTQIKAISILDDAVLYSYSGPDPHFVIHVEKKPKKIYQEGQSLEKNFYVFTGMYSYISTSGAKKSVPSFKLTNIPSPQEIHKETSSFHTPEAVKSLGEKNIKLINSPQMMSGKEYYMIQFGDSLQKIAKKHNTTVALLKTMNRLRSDTIRLGDRLLVYTGGFTIRVSKSRNRLDLLTGGKLFKHYSVGTGKFGKIPAVEFTITDKIIEPPWTRPSDNRQIEYGDPENVLGSRWMALSSTDHPELTGFGIHGTWERDSIGKQSSAGCIRMLNEDIEELFDLVPCKTPVIITN